MDETLGEVAKMGSSLVIQLVGCMSRTELFMEGIASTVPFSYPIWLGFFSMLSTAGVPDLSTW